MALTEVTESALPKNYNYAEYIFKQPSKLAVFGAYTEKNNKEGVYSFAKISSW